MNLNETIDRDKEMERLGKYGVGYKHHLPFPSRKELLTRLLNNKTYSFDTPFISNNEFDLIVIGGGSTGAGVALEAISRGLKVLLVESEDFSSGTSSRSTKLLHGGVRYLKKALTNFDLSQFHLVKEALHERWVLFNQAPHLTNFIPIITPVYTWSEIIPTYLQLKIYDWIAIPRILSSYFVNTMEALRLFPMIKQEELKGAVIYYDGQFDDARFNLAIILTLIQKGGIALNRCRVINLTHDSKTNQLNGAVIRDELTNQTLTVKSKVIINAAGHFADDIRLMDDPSSKKVLQASAGTHIVLDGKYCPPNEGLLIPRTKDNRVLFMLPWNNKTLAGTTDSPSEITNNPRPKEKEIQYILDHINQYFEVKVNRDKVLSAWSGIRPLKKAEEAKDTASISREHAIYISPSGLLTIIGGKWTTYRSMAMDILDKAIKQGNLQPICSSVTENIKLIGGDEYNPKFTSKLPFDSDIAYHLNRAYGDQSYLVADIAKKENLSNRLHPNYPFIEAEVIYHVRYEYAVKILDILERRTRISLLDNNASRSLVGKVSNLMAKELHWGNDKRAVEEKEALDYLTITSDK
ncbi:hypothetical protein ABK040_016194 [Willaertia magna]